MRLKKKIVVISRDKKREIISSVLTSKDAVRLSARVVAIPFVNITNTDIAALEKSVSTKLAVEKKTSNLPMKSSSHP